jgi:hypothetical protein
MLQRRILRGSTSVLPIRHNIPSIDHQVDYGSTILSEPAHKDNVKNLLQLESPMSDLLRNELGSDNIDILERSSREFATVSIGLKRIWSFIEGQETTLTVSESHEEDSSSYDDDVEKHRPGRTTTFFKTPVSWKRESLAWLTHCR